MKSTAFLLLSFLLLTLATKSSTANQELVGLPEPVYDSQGNMLTAGTEYYILPWLLGGGGGLTNGRASDSHTACPVDVIQLPSYQKGRRVIFTPEDSTKHIIRVSTDLKINFTGHFQLCVASTFWRVVKSSDSNKQLSIQITGLIGLPTASTFQIQKIQNSLYNHYKLALCETEICRDLSIYVEDDGTRSLVINGDSPYEVTFVKASESTNPIYAE